MKKIFALLLCALMIFAVVACDSNDEYTDDNGGDKVDASKASFYVTVGSVKVELGADADAVISALGTPKSSEPQGTCGGQGTLTKYVYTSVEIYVLSSGSSNTIDQISLLDDTVATPEGIKMGSTESDVKSKLGTPTKTSSASYTYTTGSKNLTLNFRDGSGVGVDYMIKRAA